MKTLICTRTGQPIRLVQQIASSGEGAIWQTSQSGYLAKIYYAPRPERIRKLEVMIAHPPKDPNAHIDHISFAWPCSLLQESTGTPVGFLMPQVAQAVDLLEVYHPLRRQVRLPAFNWLYLHATAMNIASLVWAIHSAGYVLGDLKPQNILVDNGALPSIIDTDSFQVRHPKTGELYRCPVGSEGFTPAELMNLDLSEIEQTEIHDRFRLGVVLYLLLFGDHPFKGRWVGTGDSPDPNELLRQGWWPYAQNSPIQPSRLTVPLKTVHPTLQQLFLRCFNEGYPTPALRPTAAEWVKGFKVAIADLKRCRRVKNHYFSQHNAHCYWCQRKGQLGIDVFPLPPKVPTTPWERLVQRTQHQVGQWGQSQTTVLQSWMVGSRTTFLHRVQSWQSVLKPGLSLEAITSVLRPKPVSLPSLPSLSSDWSAVLPQPSFRLRLSATGLMLVIALALVPFLSLIQSRLEGEEKGLTLIGVGLCFGLLAICWVLQRATSR